MRILIVIGLFLVSSPLFAATATLSWEAVTKHCNGTSIAAGKLERYEIIHSEQEITFSVTDPCTTIPQTIPDHAQITVVPVDAISFQLTVDATVSNYIGLRACKATKCSIFSPLAVFHPEPIDPEPPVSEDDPWRPVVPNNIIITIEIPTE